jgi:hypothetical protein
MARKNFSYVVEIKRAIRDLVNNLDVMSSKGELNSDGIKALVRILKLLNRSGMRGEAKKLERKLRKGKDVETIASLLLQLEEELS